MEQYLNQGIKEIISEFPQIEKVLEEYDIGCGPCMVGTCLLKDIVEIHNLQANQEQELMSRITKIIYPEKDIQIPKIERTLAGKQQISYSPPMITLVDEHKLIKRMLVLIPHIIQVLETENDFPLILETLDFIRLYADSFHHAKEEDVLFKYFDEDLEI
ncbi:MAG: hemerythrin domain-containing protein, partial [Candidatus Thorarchaeota archaeon]